MGCSGHPCAGLGPADSRGFFRAFDRSGRAGRDCVGVRRPDVPGIHRRAPSASLRILVLRRGGISGIPGGGRAARRCPASSRDGGGSLGSAVSGSGDFRRGGSLGYRQPETLSAASSGGGKNRDAC